MFHMINPEGSGALVMKCTAWEISAQRSTPAILYSFLAGPQIKYGPQLQQQHFLMQEC